MKSLGLILILGCLIVLASALESVQNPETFQTARKTSPITTEDEQAIEACPDGEERDCKGECGGKAFKDCKGVCGGNSFRDCAGVCGGTTYRDCAGVCGGKSYKDCKGECGGKAFKDAEGNCVTVEEIQAKNKEHTDKSSKTH